MSKFFAILCPKTKIAFIWGNLLDSLLFLIAISKKKLILKSTEFFQCVLLLCIKWSSTGKHEKTP